MLLGPIYFNTALLSFYYFIGYNISCKLWGEIGQYREILSVIIVAYSNNNCVMTSL